MTNKSNIISRLYWIQYLKFMTTMGYNYFKILNSILVHHIWEEIYLSHRNYCKHGMSNLVIISRLSSESWSANPNKTCITYPLIDVHNHSLLTQSPDLYALKMQTTMKLIGIKWKPECGVFLIFDVCIKLVCRVSLAN